MRVLVVEDEVYLAEAIRDGLRLSAIAADLAFDGDQALAVVGVTKAGGRHAAGMTGRCHARSRPVAG